ncbi:MAG: hypothetical protein AABM42_07365 [Actinomycetota bacterium]
MPGRMIRCVGVICDATFTAEVAEYCDGATLGRCGTRLSIGSCFN